jgi:hypothetical protein
MMGFRQSGRQKHFAPPADLCEGRLITVTRHLTPWPSLMDGAHEISHFFNSASPYFSENLSSFSPQDTCQKEEVCDFDRGKTD